MTDSVIDWNPETFPDTRSEAWNLTPMFSILFLVNLEHRFSIIQLFQREHHEVNVVVSSLFIRKIQAMDMLFHSAD